MVDSSKHTVYIDIDDEITAIIDKVKMTPGKIVALVLPKRATVLQSIVNMKLLKKSALGAKKSLVLITSEAGLMPLAGAVGLHVAKTLQSKPEIPLPPDRSGSDDTDITEAIGDDEVVELDKTKAVGVLAAGNAKAADNDETEIIELDDLNVDDDEPSKKTRKANGGFKIPNFDRFRLSFFLVVLAVILLIGGWVLAIIILPKAKVVIQTDTSSISSNFNFTINTTYNDLNVDQAQVPAVQKEIKKTDSEKATATGKQDNGTKATGTMTLTNCIHDNDGHVVPAGTGFNNGSLTFVTNEEVDLPVSTFQGNNCKSSNVGDSKDVGVTAASGGTGYNIAAAAYSSPISGITAYGSAMAGGTTNLITIVSQSDVDGAVAKMKGRLDSAAATDLANQLQASGLKGLDDTKTTSDPVITSTPAVGAVATGDITVTSVTAYDILGVKTDYLNQLIKKDLGSKIDSSKQSILDNGLGAASIHVVSRKSPTEATMSLQALVVAGPHLDANVIKTQIRGMKRGDAENLIKAKPGVQDVTITYSPFWVLSTPKSIKKITIIIEKPVMKPAMGGQTNDVSNP